MAIARITGTGLLAMALSVALLWGCLVSERLLMHQARRENARILYELRTLQLRHLTPAAAPLAPTPHPLRPVTG